MQRYERDGHEVIADPQGNPQAVNANGEGAGVTRPQEGLLTDAWEDTDVSNGSSRASRHANAENDKQNSPATPAAPATPAVAATTAGTPSGNRSAGTAAIRNRSYSSSPGYLLWKRLTWQVFAKKGSVATFVGCVTHVPMWDGQKIYEQVGGLFIKSI